MGMDLIVRTHSKPYFFLRKLFYTIITEHI